MKIYIAIDNIYGKLQNPYIKTLVEGINTQFNDVEWGYGISNFWNDNIYDYDIIHIHWPNVFAFSSKYRLDDSQIFEKRILELKSRKIKIISTCHNFVPHYSKIQLEYDL